MSLVVFERTFRIRYSECDPYGRLKDTQYIRLMLETAFDASASVGYSFEKYQQIGCHWIIRLTDIEYLHPLYHDDIVCVRTWVEDFQRVRSLRRYEFRKPGTNELVAQAVTDWVFLDSKSGIPKSIPPEIITAYLPERGVRLSRSRRRFPNSPPPPEGVFRMVRQVEWRDLDIGQHVNNAVYLAFLEEAAIRHYDSRQWSLAKMNKEGFGIFAQGHIIEYLQPARLGETLLVSTWLSNIRRESTTRHYEIHRQTDQQLIARSRSDYVWTDLSSNKPIRIPERFLQDFSDNIVLQQ